MYIYIEKDCPEFTVQQGKETQKYSESISYWQRASVIHSQYDDHHIAIAVNSTLWPF